MIYTGIALCYKIFDLDLEFLKGVQSFKALRAKVCLIEYIVM